MNTETTDTKTEEPELWVGVPNNPGNHVPLSDTIFMTSDCEDCDMNCYGEAEAYCDCCNTTLLMNRGTNAEGRLQKILRLHPPVRTDDSDAVCCAKCDETYPCSTVSLVVEVPAEDKGEWLGLHNPSRHYRGMKTTRCLVCKERHGVCEPDSPCACCLREQIKVLYSHFGAKPVNYLTLMAGNRKPSEML